MKIIIENNNNAFEKLCNIDYDIENYTENKKGYGEDIVYISKENDLCLKVYSNSKYSKNNYETELKNLILLSNYDYFPKYIGNQENKILMEYCGEKITKDNIPNDCISQINDIIEIFRHLSITHNDIHPDNILVKNNKIKLIDFSFMHNINNSKCHLIPNIMKEIVIDNIHDINIRLRSEKECFLLSIESIKTGKNYWDNIYINLNSFSLSKIKNKIKEYYYYKVNDL